MDKLNIAEILKDCPSGTKLYSTVHGEVKLVDIFHKLIRCKLFDGISFVGFHSNGEWIKDVGECILFPSKDQRDWSKFHRPFKDGDIVRYIDSIAIFKEWGDETLFRTHVTAYLHGDSTIDIATPLFGKSIMREACFATEEEKQKLFDAIKTNGYHWDNETKTLVKLVESKFKIEKGKWYVCIKNLLDNYANKAFCKGDTYYSPEDGYLIPSNSNVPSKVEYCTDEYFRDWSIQDAKDGDVIFYDDGWTCIFKSIHGIWYSSYCFITDDGDFHTGYERHAVDSEINGNAHPATKEQCNFLFQKIKEAGYKWNPETKILDELIAPKFKVGDIIKEITSEKHKYTIINVTDEVYVTKEDNKYTYYINLENECFYELVLNKFDITTLKPFDKVLVRDNYNEPWNINYFSYIDSAKMFKTIMGTYLQCIPYEGNEYLLGTFKDCNDYYKTWKEL